MTTEICLLLAAERSGTHMLRSQLDQAPGVRAVGEIANASAANARTDDMSFLKFRKEAWLANHAFFFADSELQTGLLERYFDHVRAAHADKKLVVLDVKYGHVGVFSAARSEPALRPFLLEFAQKHAIKVIHLVRSKVYQTAISLAYAQETGVWRTRNATEVKTVPIVVDERALKRRVNRIIQSVEAFDHWLSSCDHVRVSYEGVLDGAGTALKDLGAFLGLDADIPANSAFVRTTPPYEQSIANFAEIAPFIDVDLADVRVRRGRERDPVDRRGSRPARKGP